MRQSERFGRNRKKAVDLRKAFKFKKPANNRMQVTPRAADYYEGRLAWARLLGLFRVSRAPDAER